GLGATRGGHDELLPTCSRGDAGACRLGPAQAVRGSAERGEQYSTERELLSSSLHTTSPSRACPAWGGPFTSPLRTAAFTVAPGANRPCRRGTRLPAL